MPSVCESHLWFRAGPILHTWEDVARRGRGQAGEGCAGGKGCQRQRENGIRLPETVEPTERGCRFGTHSRTFRLKKRLSSLRALIFMRHGNFDTEKVSVTFSCVRIFYFSRKLQSSNDLINAGVSARFGRAVSLGFGAVRLGAGAAGGGGDSHPHPRAPTEGWGHLPTFVLI